jgi:uncharacterized membrane protein YfcA
MSLFGVAGAIVGSYLSGVIDQGLLRKLFGAMLITCGLVSLRGRKDGNTEEITIKDKKSFQKN